MIAVNKLLQLSLVEWLHSLRSWVLCYSCLGNPIESPNALRHILGHGGERGHEACKALLTLVLAYLDSVSNVTHNGKHLCVSVICFLPWSYLDQSMLSAHGFPVYSCSAPWLTKAQQANTGVRLQSWWPGFYCHTCILLAKHWTSKHGHLHGQRG